MKIKIRCLASVLLLTPSIWALNTSVLSYGAKGDGITDDTVAIVNASTAVARSGGQLYFPAGTYMINPNKGHIVLGSNMTVYGSGVIRVEPNTGNFQYVMGPSPTWQPTSNVSIQDITIDENVLNNPSTVAPTLTQTQDIILGNAMTGLIVNNVLLYTSGIDAIKTENNINLSNSKIVFQRRPGAAWFDNSAIYLGTENSTCSITNNIFQGGTDGANTAIEVHYTQSCTISGNTFDNYTSAVLPKDTYSLSFTGNTVTRAQYAVSLWAESEIQNVSVTHNNISLNNRDRQSNSAAGVALYWCSYCQPVGSFYNIQIEDNTITFQPDVTTNLAASGYWGIGIMPAGNVDTVYIARNTIINATIRAITIGNSLAPNQRTSGVLVEDNTIINPGNDTALPWYEAGICLQGHLSSVIVRDNTIENQASPFTGRYGIWSDPSGSYSNVSVYSNQVDPVYSNSLVSAIAH